MAKISAVEAVRRLKLAIAKDKELQARIDELESRPTSSSGDADRIAELEKEAARVPGLREGNRKADLAVEAALEAVRLRIENLRLQKENATKDEKLAKLEALLRDRERELEGLKKDLATARGSDRAHGRRPRVVATNLTDLSAVTAGDQTAGGGE